MEDYRLTDAARAYLRSTRPHTAAYLEQHGVTTLKSKLVPHRFEVIIGRYDDLPPEAQREVARHWKRAHLAYMVFPLELNAFAAALSQPATQAVELPPPPIEHQRNIELS